MAHGFGLTPKATKESCNMSEFIENLKASQIEYSIILGLAGVNCVYIRALKESHYFSDNQITGVKNES